MLENAFKLRQLESQHENDNFQAVLSNLQYMYTCHSARGDVRLYAYYL